VKYDIQQAFLAKFSDQERSIIQAASVMRDVQFELWSPALGITNIYNQKQYLDPNGMLPMSLK